MGAVLKAELSAPVRLPALDPDAESKRPENGPGDRIAVVVCHGMGQQVRFETLMDLAEVLGRGDPSSRGTARPVTIDTDPRIDTHRVEMQIHAADGHCDVHLYESYWAPLTEGKVSGRDVLDFLVSSAVKGWLNVRGKTFRRWMFGRPIDLPIKSTSTRRRLWGALVIVLSLIVINALALLVGAFRTFGFKHEWPGSSLPELMSAEVLALIIVLILGGASVVLAGRKTPGRKNNPRAVALGWAGVWVSLGAIVLVASVMTVELIASLFKPQHDQPLRPELAFGLLVLWFALLVVTYAVRAILVQYVGDVAAYVSPYKVSKFYELREAIQKAACEVIRAVYTALDSEGEGFEYGRVILVGHSLGSVVAYDALNAMIREDRIAKTPFHVVGRTPLLLTFGSPLNKTAFIFRTQLPEGSDIREALSASVQPLIQSYDLRPDRWVNIYSPADWISGRLDFYDDPEESNANQKRIRNEADPDATTPLFAHAEYWQNDLLSSRLLECIREQQNGPEDGYLGHRHPPPETTDR